MNISEEEFANIINDNRGRLRHLSRVYARHSYEEKDIFQEIIIQIWHSLPSFKEDAKLSTWLYRVGVNTAISFVRKRNTRQQYHEAYKNEQDEHSSQNFEVSHQSNSEQLDKIYRAIEKLNLSERTIITMYLEDFSYQEIAYVTDLTQNHVGVKLNRIKNKLSKSIGG